MTGSTKFHNGHRFSKESDFGCEISFSVCEDEVSTMLATILMRRFFSWLYELGFCYLATSGHLVLAIN
jgi:hypothetical protein